MDLIKEEQIIDKALNYAKENDKGYAKVICLDDELYGYLVVNRVPVYDIGDYVGLLRISTNSQTYYDPNIPDEDKYYLKMKIIYRVDGNKEFRISDKFSPEGKIDMDVYKAFLDKIEDMFDKKYHINSDIEQEQEQMER